MKLCRRRRRPPYAPKDNPRAVPESEHVPGTLPTFSKPLGLDFIITAEQRVVLVELQQGFGRRGLVSLFPDASRAYRKAYWAWRRELGKSPVVAEGFRDICSDKINTYKYFAKYQPASMVFVRWNRKAEQWLDSLDSELILAKPPRGSCGRGILVLEREDFIRRQGQVELGSACLLQEYVPSKPLLGADGEGHVGCIRHIMLLCSDGQRLSFHHTPSYWRVSPEPMALAADREAFTANISRGAYPVPVSDADLGPVRDAAETISRELLQIVLDLPHIEPGERGVLDGQSLS